MRKLRISLGAEVQEIAIFGIKPELENEFEYHRFRVFRYIEPANKNDATEKLI